MPDVRTSRIADLAQQVRSGATLESLESSGSTPDELMAVLRMRAEQRNRDAQQLVPEPAISPDSDWEARKAWLLDGQPIYGELKEFYFAALECLRSDDQTGYSRARDLLFKAVRTFIGEPPQTVTDQPEQPVLEDAPAPIPLPVALFPAR